MEVWPLSVCNQGAGSHHKEERQGGKQGSKLCYRHEKLGDQTSSLLIIRKQVGPGAMATAALEGNLSCLTYLVDVSNSRKYLVGSGRTISIIPYKSSSQARGPRLATADGAICAPFRLLIS